MSITDSNIQIAVTLWLANPEKAESTFGHIKDWDTTNVTNMSGIFSNASSFNEDIGGWNTENVTDMSGMFSGASTFNQDIGKWNTSKVVSMISMFANAFDFNQDISTKIATDSSGNIYVAWDTSSVTSMLDMLAIGGMVDVGTSSEGNFNNGQSSEEVPTKPLYWNTSNVTNMRYLFKGQKKYNQVMNNKEVIMNERPYIAWDTSKVGNMSEMFRNTDIFNQDIGSWNLTSLKNADFMFSNSIAINQRFDNFQEKGVSYTGTDGEITTRSGVRTISVYKMFTNAISQTIGNFEIIPITNDNIKEAVSFNLSNISLSRIRYGSISDWDTNQVSDMSSLFENTTFNEDISSWDTSSVSNMNDMFNGATQFNQSINNWSLTSLSSADNMFKDAISIDQQFYNFRDKGVQFFGSNRNILAFSGNSGVSVENMFLGATSQTIKGKFCFLAGTPVMTDQGQIAIEKINCDNTINKRLIKKILSFKNYDSFMVMFKENSLGQNIPNKDTLVSQNHGVYLREHNIKAKALLNGNTIFKVHLKESPIVYNILLEGTKKQKILINNMKVETMCPRNYNRINGVRYLKSLSK